MSKIITVYSRTTCGSCSMVKRYLKAKQLDYKEINLDDSPELSDAIIRKSGAQTVPITVVQSQPDKGQQEAIVIGWNPAKLTEALAV